MLRSKPGKLGRVYEDCRGFLVNFLNKKKTQTFVSLFDLFCVGFLFFSFLPPPPPPPPPPPQYG